MEMSAGALENTLNNLNKNAIERIHADSTAQDESRL
jgi:hypothetical protein